MGTKRGRKLVRPNEVTSSARCSFTNNLSGAGETADQFDAGRYPDVTLGICLAFGSLIIESKPLS
jgi:hypothetical protein